MNPSLFECAVAAPCCAVLGRVVFLVRIMKANLRRRAAGVLLLLGVIFWSFWVALIQVRRDVLSCSFLDPSGSHKKLYEVPYATFRHQGNVT